MSFFYTPVGSQSFNYCVFMSFMPCLFQVPEKQNFCLNSQLGINDVNPQELKTEKLISQEANSQLRKESELQQESSNLKNSGDFCIQSKKQTAALQQQEIDLFERVLKDPLKGNKQETRFGKQRKQNYDGILKTIKIKKIKELNEDQYKPFQKRKKIATSSRQNENRNIIPNEVNQIFSYIQKSSKSRIVVSRIFKKYAPNNESFSIKKFYLYQSILKQKVSNYINQQSLSLVTQLYEPRCQVYSEQEQRYYNKVCRILIHHFLQEDSIFNILTSRRMHREKKRNHLQMRRILNQKVVKILRH